MTGHPWLDLGLGAAVALALSWLLLVIALAVGRPQGKLLSESLRLLPDLLRLLRRLAADRAQPTGVRVRLGLLLVYLAMPIDLIPDFIPVLGYADDAIIVTMTLRSVARRTGVGELHRHWPGTEDGFHALCRLVGLSPDGPSHTKGRHVAPTQADPGSAANPAAVATRRDAGENRC
ncbi:YkvA family protein [Friedmanniella luteola]|uniref:YkvA family protein n=1 Tax=Friedmanniella luteola TaxID=546871 RepID=UPI000B88E445|nr:YkvA family protein [Friedmanniella luteola]